MMVSTNSPQRARANENKVFPVRDARALKRMIRTKEQFNKCAFLLSGCDPSEDMLGTSTYGSSLRCRLHDQVCANCWFIIVRAYAKHVSSLVRVRNWQERDKGSDDTCFACYDISHVSYTGWSAEDITYNMARKNRMYLFDNARKITDWWAENNARPTRSTATSWLAVADDTMAAIGDLQVVPPTPRTPMPPGLPAGTPVISLCMPCGLRL
jgi:hypothetical protein